MGASLLIPAETLTSGSAQGSARLPKIAQGRSVAVQLDTDGTLTIGAVVIELRNAHPAAVNGGGWINYTAELESLVGDDLTSTQGAAAYNFSFAGHEEIRVTVPHAGGSGDVSVTIHAAP